MSTSRSRPRLMLAIGSLANGGSEKQLTELAIRLPRDRFDLVLATVRGAAEGAHGRRICDAGIPILGISPGQGGVARRWATHSREYVGMIRSLRPDVVYAWLDETAAFVAPICRALKVPCLVARRNLIGSSLERRYRIIGAAQHRAERQALLVTANSAAVARACLERGHHPDRIRVVPNGHEDLPPLPPPPPGPITFGYVAQFRAEKGHHRLIDALERMEPGDWRVDLAGAGPLQSEIEQRIIDGRLQDRVRLLGPVTGVREFWRERHVALLLSDSEGMPNALLEAAFAGRPAIATLTGGTPEVVGDGGILVPLDEPSHTARAMQTLIDAPQWREELGAAIHRHVAQRFSMKAMVGGHVLAIEEARELALAGDNHG